MSYGVIASRFRRRGSGRATTIDGLPVVNSFGEVFYVDTVNGAAGGDAGSPDSAVLTVQAALNKVTKDYPTIFVTGDVREQVATPAFNYGQLIGLSPSPRGVRWRAPASPTATTPLLQLKQRGWLVNGFLFIAPTDDAAIEVFRDGSFNAQDCVIEDCEFNTGAIAIASNGGAPNVIVRRNRIHDMTSGSVATAGAIISTSTAQALPQRWIIENNYLINNVNHIVMPLKIGQIKGNTFSDVGDSITSDIIIDLTSGDHNNVNGNYLPGAYTSTLYVAGTADDWMG